MLRIGGGNAVNFVYVDDPVGHDEAGFTAWHQEFQGHWREVRYCPIGQDYTVIEEGYKYGIIV